MCQLSDVAATVLGLELGTIILFIVFVQILLLVRIRRTIPGSVVRRSILCASGYLCACSASYGLYTLGYVIPFLRQGADKVVHQSESKKLVHLDWYFFFAWRLLLLNGFFNFLAMLFHFRKLILRRSSPQRRSVALSGSQEVLQVPAVDYQTWSTVCEEQIQKIREENREARRVWADLGLDFSDDEDVSRSSTMSGDDLPRDPWIQILASSLRPATGDLEAQVRPTCDDGERRPPQRMCMPPS